MIEITNEMRVWMTPHSDYTDERMKNGDLKGLVFLPMDQNMSGRGWIAIGTATVHAKLSEKNEIADTLLNNLRDQIAKLSTDASVAINKLEEKINLLTEGKA